MLFWLRKLPEYHFLAQAFANLHEKRCQGSVETKLLYEYEPVPTIIPMTRENENVPPDDAFRAGLRKLGPKNNIPEVFLTRKAKNMNHGSPLFPTIYIYIIYIYIYI